MKEDLAKHRLVRFVPADGSEWPLPVPVYLLFPHRRPLGRAGTLLLNELRKPRRDMQ